MTVFYQVRQCAGQGARFLALIGIVVTGLVSTGQSIAQEGDLVGLAQFEQPLASQFRNDSLADYQLPLTQPESGSTAFSPYQRDMLEPAIEDGLLAQENGNHSAAIAAFDQALQITRVSYGLYHESQIPLVESIIYSAMEMAAWDAVDDRFTYLEHLYRRLYDVDDPKLESGLQKVSSFHVNAFNINLDGRQEYHLRQAARLFQLRLEVAEHTLTEDHPKFDYLNQSIALSRQHLYLLSNRHKELLRLNARGNRDNLLADLD